MLDKTKVSCMVKKHSLLFMAPTLFARILRDICYISPKIRVKRIGVKKDKICILKIQDTKCQGTQIKAVLTFGIKERNTKRGGSLYSPLYTHL